MKTATCSLLLAALFACAAMASNPNPNSNSNVQSSNNVQSSSQTTPQATPPEPKPCSPQEQDDRCPAAFDAVVEAGCPAKVLEIEPGTSVDTAALTFTTARCRPRNADAAKMVFHNVQRYVAPEGSDVEDVEGPISKAGRYRLHFKCDADNSFHCKVDVTVSVVSYKLVMGPSLKEKMEHVVGNGFSVDQVTVKKTAKCSVSSETIKAVHELSLPANKDDDTTNGLKAGHHKITYTHPHAEPLEVDVAVEAKCKAEWKPAAPKADKAPNAHKAVQLTWAILCQSDPAEGFKPIMFEDTTADKAARLHVTSGVAKWGSAASQSNAIGWSGNNGLQTIKDGATFLNYQVNFKLDSSAGYAAADFASPKTITVAIDFAEGWYKDYAIDGVKAAWKGSDGQFNAANKPSLSTELTFPNKAPTGRRMAL